MQEDVIQQLRVERIRKAQEEESWIMELKAYLKGDLGGLSAESAQSCSKMARDYEISEEGLLMYCPVYKTDEDDRGLTARLVIPESLQTDVLHHYHTSLEGGHQGVGRTYYRTRRYCHWRGCFEAYSGMWAYAWTVRQGKGGLHFKGRPQEISRRPTLSKS